MLRARANLILTCERCSDCRITTEVCCQDESTLNPIAAGFASTPFWPRSMNARNRQSTVVPVQQPFFSMHSSHHRFCCPQNDDRYQARGVRAGRSA